MITQIKLEETLNFTKFKNIMVLFVGGFFPPILEAGKANCPW